MAHVSIQNVSDSWPAEKGRGNSAVRDFSIEVEDREFVVLAGPAGCGNTTILRMIAGLDGVSSGEISVGGKRLNDVPPKDRDAALVIRNLYPHMTVFGNLAFGLKLRRFPEKEIKKRVAEAAAGLGVEDCLKRKPDALCAGERERVAIGRAVARQPKVFLFDEPLMDLEAHIRVQLRAEIIKLHHRVQATIIYATADQCDAMTMAGRVVVMNDGVIQQAGPPAALYREPGNLFVAGFLGVPPMNFIRGKLRESGGALTFKEADGGVIEFKLAERAGAKAFAGREIIAGIRPEDIEIVAGSERAPGRRFQSLVDIVEPMGAESYVHLQTGAHTLVCRTRTPIGHEDAGHRMQFEIDPARVHLFDPGTSRRISA